MADELHVTVDHVEEVWPTLQRLAHEHPSRPATVEWVAPEVVPGEHDALLAWAAAALGRHGRYGPPPGR